MEMSLSTFKSVVYTLTGSYNFKWSGHSSEYESWWSSRSLHHRPVQITVDVSVFHQMPTLSIIYSSSWFSDWTGFISVSFSHLVVIQWYYRWYVPCRSTRPDSVWRHKSLTASLALLVLCFCSFSLLTITEKLQRTKKKFWETLSGHRKCWLKVLDSFHVAHKDLDLTAMGY